MCFCVKHRNCIFLKNFAWYFVIFVIYIWRHTTTLSLKLLPFGYLHFRPIVVCPPRHSMPLKLCGFQTQSFIFSYTYSKPAELFVSAGLLYSNIKLSACCSGGLERYIVVAALNNACCGNNGELCILLKVGNVEHAAVAHC